MTESLLTVAKRNKSSNLGRGVTRTANLRLPLDFSEVFPSPRPVFSVQPSLPNLPLIEVEDRRRYHPSGDRRSALNQNGRQHTLKASGTLTHPRVGFEDAQRVLVCVRRKTRKEVLHARRKTGKTGQKRPRFNYLSSITCKG